jgi:hypothetical protein
VRAIPAPGLGDVLERTGINVAAGISTELGRTPQPGRSYTIRAGVALDTLALDTLALDTLALDADGAGRRRRWTLAGLDAGRAGRRP